MVQHIAPQCIRTVQHTEHFGEYRLSKSWHGSGGGFFIVFSPYIFATFFLSWGIAGTLIAGPIIDVMIASGAPEVLSYRVSFMAAAVMTSVGILIMAGLVFYTRRKRLAIG